MAAIIAAKQLGLREAMPDLRRLLSDDSWVFVRRGDTPWVRVYEIRAAARETLEALGENPGRVVTDETLP